MLAADEYNSTLMRKKNAGPSVWVRKEDEEKRR
jgi:hypothetical protein